jgi:hypothetical protein
MIYLVIFFLLLLVGLLSWYCYKLTNKLLFLSDNMEELFIRLDEFDRHINFIYELEMFYGDETLKNLIRHSRDLRDYMKSYKNVIELDGEVLEMIEGNNDESDESESEKTENDEENQVRISGQGKTIFYQGA